jgi:hypothetical protein
VRVCEFARPACFFRARTGELWQERRGGVFCHPRPPKFREKQTLLNQTHNNNQEKMPLQRKELIASCYKGARVYHTFSSQCNPKPDCLPAYDRLDYYLPFPQQKQLLKPSARKGFRSRLQLRREFCGGM